MYSSPRFKPFQIFEITEFYSITSSQHSKYAYTNQPYPRQVLWAFSHYFGLALLYVAVLTGTIFYARNLLSNHGTWCLILQPLVLSTISVWPLISIDLLGWPIYLVPEELEQLDLFLEGWSCIQW